MSNQEWEEEKEKREAWREIKNLEKRIAELEKHLINIYMDEIGLSREDAEEAIKGGDV